MVVNLDTGEKNVPKPVLKTVKKMCVNKLLVNVMGVRVTLTMVINVISYVKKDVIRTFVYKLEDVFQVVRINIGDIIVNSALRTA